MNHPSLGFEAPNYLSLSPTEKGSGVGISSTDYSFLARTALAATRDIDVTMGIYRHKMQASTVLDIWSKDQCLSIAVDSEAGELCLFLWSDLDSGQQPICLLDLSNSPDDWHLLKQTAKAQLSH